MADLIALNVVTSVGGCSSPTLRIPLRGGRIDATEGGETGVPEPESSLEETLAISAKTGFNQSDLIACSFALNSKFTLIEISGTHYLWTHHGKRASCRISASRSVPLIGYHRPTSDGILLLLVPESAVTPDNLGGAIHFDATPGIFDHNVYASVQSQPGM